MFANNSKPPILSIGFQTKGNSLPTSPSLKCMKNVPTSPCSKPPLLSLTCPKSPKTISKPTESKLDQNNLLQSKPNMIKTIEKKAIDPITDYDLFPPLNQSTYPDKNPITNIYKKFDKPFKNFKTKYVAKPEAVCWEIKSVKRESLVDIQNQQTLTNKEFINVSKNGDWKVPIVEKTSLLSIQIEQSLL